MGYIKHNCIVVTTCDEKIAKKVHENVLDIVGGDAVSEILLSQMNGYLSFFIAPDGSKEGWQESNDGDERRDYIKKLLSTYPYVDWVEVRYGGDDGGVYVVANSDCE